MQARTKLHDLDWAQTHISTSTGTFCLDLRNCLVLFRLRWGEACLQILKCLDQLQDQLLWQFVFLLPQLPSDDGQINRLLRNKPKAKSLPQKFQSKLATWGIASNWWQNMWLNKDLHLHKHQTLDKSLYTWEGSEQNRLKGKNSPFIDVYKGQADSVMSLNEYCSRAPTHLGKNLGSLVPQDSLSLLAKFLIFNKYDLRTFLQSWSCLFWPVIFLRIKKACLNCFQCGWLILSRYQALKVCPARKGLHAKGSLKQV